MTQLIELDRQDTGPVLAAETDGPGGGGTTTRPTVTPATPCPAWCTAGHRDPDDRFHYGQDVYAGATSVSPQIDEDGERVVIIRTDGGNGDRLYLDEIDEMITRLAELRGVLAGRGV